MMSVFKIKPTLRSALLLFVLLLAFMDGGCGSSGGDPDPPSPGPTPAQTSAVTAGPHHIFEERFPPCHEGGYLQYDITVSQEAGTDTAIVIMDNQFLSCSADNADKTLYCAGQLKFDDAWSPYYSLYSIMQQPDEGLLGETEYQITAIDAECEPTNPTTYTPEFGSFVIKNTTSDYMEYVALLSCGSNLIGRNEIGGMDINPQGGSMYLYDVEPACYDVIVCGEVQPTDYEYCAQFNTLFLDTAETLRLTVYDESGELHILREPQGTYTFDDIQAPWLHEMTAKHNDRNPD